MGLTTNLVPILSSVDKRLNKVEVERICIKGKRANLSSEQRLKEVEAARDGMKSTRANLSSEQEPQGSRGSKSWHEEFSVLII